MMLNLVWNLVLLMLSLGFIFSFIRLVKGPRLPDRVIALDLLTILIIGFITVYSARTHQPVFLDVVTILALIGFLGTVAFAYYIERRI